MSRETYDKRWKALAVLGIAYLRVVLDVSIVNSDGGPRAGDGAEAASSN
jgi:hypothetical protein